ncbi:Probable RNA-directed DNA polymerase from transposon X-element [Eumeta japonica]|uniref:Probable RNA-directed DNA polymerase from transposon X-element n=1 Tax=Eumeta variegata TaxID=151549 RepID=A0A4C2ABC3_EUMVA|nr:Probable RNA-directed DNA polymerase from transposon X-element [Eumeta japonica]
MHPNGKAHGGSAILIKSTIKHYQSQPHCKDYIQATNVVVSAGVDSTKRPRTAQKRSIRAYEHNLDRTTHILAHRQRQDTRHCRLLHFQSVQSAAWNSTPINQHKLTEQHIPTNILQKISEKRALRKLWQQNRCPETKKRLNHKIKELKRILNNDRNVRFQAYLESLDPTAATDYSLWKATKKIKRPTVNSPPLRKPDGSWARSDHERVDAFAEHLTNVFKPHPYEGPPEHEKMVMECSREAAAESTMPKKYTTKEVRRVIQKANTKKSPGYDLITNKILKELPNSGPSPIPSKIYESLLLLRILPLVEQHKIIPDHQFGFRRKHATVDQIHRLINEIDKSFESKEYCASVFLDISQAFDRVWHEGLLFKIKSSLPNYICQILESFIQNRRFVVQHGEALSRLCDINAGVPQGSVLGPLLYLIYTSDLPTSDCITTGTFADDTAILASHQDPAEASKSYRMALTIF